MVLHSILKTMTRALQHSKLAHASLHDAERVDGIDESHNSAPMTRCLRKFQATTMLGQDIDPLTGAFDLQRRPRLLGMQLSLVRLLILTLHLIGVSDRIKCNSAYLDPIHMQHADCPGQTLGFVLIHRFVSSIQRAYFPERLIFTMLKNSLHARLEQYSMLGMRRKGESLIFSFLSPFKSRLKRADLLYLQRERNRHSTCSSEIERCCMPSKIVLITGCW